MAAYKNYCELTIIQAYILPRKFLAQIGTHQSAPYFLPTPFCENRYRIIAVLAERCCYFCKVSPLFGDNRVVFTKFSVLHKGFTAFAYNIRAPPSEVNTPRRMVHADR